jgi:hypothetical protein
MNGEGFAYFRWHALKWPDGTGRCEQDANYICVQLWKEMRAAQRRGNGL